MKIDIIQIGNSKGIRIPKALLEECGINGSVNITVENKKLIISSARKPREGWAEAAKLCHERGDDDSAEMREWREFPNKFDDEEWTW